MLNALQTVEVDLVARHEVQQAFERNRALHAGQRGTEAAVDAIAEPEVLRLVPVAVDVEGLAAAKARGSRLAAAPIRNTGLFAGIVPLGPHVLHV